jgi:hypothetical protein
MHTQSSTFGTFHVKLTSKKNRILQDENIENAFSVEKLLEIN